MKVATLVFHSDFRLEIEPPADVSAPFTVRIGRVAAQQIADLLAAAARIDRNSGKAQLVAPCVVLEPKPSPATADSSRGSRVYLDGPPPKRGRVVRL